VRIMWLHGKCALAAKLSTIAPAEAGGHIDAETLLLLCDYSFAAPWRLRRDAHVRRR
jgi:hypothetical protein